MTVLPTALPVNTFDGQAWIGVTPFEVTGSMTRPWRIELPRVEPVLHFARVQNVVIWPLRLAG